MSRRTLPIGLAAWWLWMPAAIGALWLLNRLVFAGMTWSQTIATILRVDFFPAVGHPTPIFWLWVVIGLVGSGVITFTAAEREDSGGLALAGAAGGVVALIVLATLVIPGGWHNKMEGQYYNTGLVVKIQSGQAPPPSLYYLLQGAEKTDGRCVYDTRHDVPSCTVVEPDLKAVDGYEGRTSPYAAAKQMMQNANTIPKVSVAVPTINYLYGAKPGSGGVWTAILDGEGKYRHAYGTATWNGAQNQAQTACAFNNTDDRFDRAFSGSRGNSLPNWLADKYPTLHYDLSDASAYCQGDRPVYVLPVTRFVRFKNRAMSTAAGVLVLTGSRHGVAATYRRHVRAGEFPVPVYPASLVVKQREMIPWAAGRKYRDSFGFSPTNDPEIQGENPGEYVLRNPEDKRLYFVTPLTPGNSPSQTITAYGVSRADVVNDRQLNPYNLNVLPTGDPRITQLKTLDNVVANFVTADNPSFLNTGGKIEEITPLGGDMWRAYGTRNHQVEYYVDVSANNRIAPKKVVVNAALSPGQPPTGQPNGQPPAVTGSGAACGKPATKMTSRELADCLAAIAQRTRTLK